MEWHIHTCLLRKYEENYDSHFDGLFLHLKDWKVKSHLSMLERVSSLVNPTSWPRTLHPRFTPPKFWILPCSFFTILFVFTVTSPLSSRCSRLLGNSAPCHSSVSGVQNLALQIPPTLRSTCFLEYVRALVIVEAHVELRHNEAGKWHPPPVHNLQGRCKWMSNESCRRNWLLRSTFSIESSWARIMGVVFWSDAKQDYWGCSFPSLFYLFVLWCLYL